MLPKSLEPGSYVTVPNSRGTYHTDGTNLYRLGSLVPPDGKGRWRIQTNSRSWVVGREDLAQMMKEYLGADIGTAPEAPGLPQEALEEEMGTATQESDPSDPRASQSLTEGIRAVAHGQ